MTGVLTIYAPSIAEAREHVKSCGPECHTQICRWAKALTEIANAITDQLQEDSNA